MTERQTTKTAGISRRSLLKTGAAAAGACRRLGRHHRLPDHLGAEPTITLRQFGTGVSNLNAIAEKCKADLGITLEMTATDSDAAAQRAVTQPDSYDIADIEYWILQEGRSRPASCSRWTSSKLKYFDKIVPLFNNRQADAGQRHRPGHRAAHGRLRRRRRTPRPSPRTPTGWFTHGPDHLQRRHARHPPRPRRPRRSPPGPTSWTRPSRARPRSSTSRRSASWTRR